MIALAVDPDLHATAVAVCDEAHVLHVAVARVPSSVKGRQAVEAMVSEVWPAVQMAHEVVERDGVNVVHVIAIEHQQIYGGAGKETKNWDSIVALGPITGAAAAAGLYCRGGPVLMLPKPHEWKGNAPKHITQARALQHYGLRFDYVGQEDRYRYCRVVAPHEVPGGKDLRDADWKHVSDAIALCRWALKSARPGTPCNPEALGG